MQIDWFGSVAGADYILFASKKGVVDKGDSLACHSEALGELQSCPRVGGELREKRVSAQQVPRICAAELVDSLSRITKHKQVWR